MRLTALGLAALFATACTANPPPIHGDPTPPAVTVAIPPAPAATDTAVSASPSASASAAPSAPEKPVPPSSCAVAARLARFRRNASLSLLADGTVLIAGGKQHDDGGFVADVDRFDPRTKTLKPAAKLRAARARHGAAVAGDGRVVVVSGRATPDVEVYDPKKDRWTKVGAVKTAVVDPAVVTLPSGDVLIAGGDLMWKGALSDEVLVFETKTSKLKKAAKLPDQQMGRFAFRLPDGRAAFVGARPTGAEAPEEIPDAVYDQAADRWVTGPLADPTALALHAFTKLSKDADWSTVLLRPVQGQAPLLLVGDKGVKKEVRAFQASGKAPMPLVFVDQMDASAVMIDEHTAVVAGGDEGETAVLLCTFGV